MIWIISILCSALLMWFGYCVTDYMGRWRYYERTDFKDMKMLEKMVDKTMDITIVVGTIFIFAFFVFMFKLIITALGFGG